MFCLKIDQFLLKNVYFCYVSAILFFQDLKDLKKENDFNVFCSITKCKSGRKEQKQVFFQDIVNIDVGVLKF